MRYVCAVAALAVAVGCGGGGGSNTAPAPVVTAPTISTSNTMIYVGQNVTFSATGTGTIRWGGDTPGVATVDATTGRVSGVGIGQVTIWAENDGGRTTRLLRGLPSFAGIWRGSYVVTGCQENGIFQELGFCTTSALGPGAVAPIALNITQTEDRITSAAIALGSIIGTLTNPTVNEAGQVQMNGTMNEIPDNMTRVAIEGMRLESPSPGVITGQYEQVWTVAGFSGNGRLTARIDSLTRESGGPSLMFRAPAPLPPGPSTLEDFVRLILR